MFMYLQHLFRFIPDVLSSHRETIVGTGSCDNVQCQVAFIAALLPKPSSFGLDHNRAGNDGCLELNNTALV